MLYEAMNYTADISYLSNVFIYEYDISKANINILYTKGLIDQSTYEYLYNSERMVRQVFVGKLQRDNRQIIQALKDGIIEAKKQLFETNNILDREVLSIKNDAVFIINRKLLNTKFGIIEFIPKNVYTSFFRIFNYEIYYYYNKVTQQENIYIKGISDKDLANHEGYFLQFLKDIFYSIQVNGPEISMMMLKDYYNEFISLHLPPGHYREFRVNGEYHFKFKTNINTGFTIDYIGEDMKPLLDISYNTRILMEIQKILVSMYFSKH